MKQINTRNMSHKERQDAVNEIRILASVVNPYVISFCEAFVEDDILYIITECDSALRRHAPAAGRACGGG